jgi:hypothetical protein
MKSAIVEPAGASSTGGGASATGTITGGALLEEPLLGAPDPTPVPPALQPDSRAAMPTAPPHLDAALPPRNFPEFIGIDRSVSVAL